MLIRSKREREFCYFFNYGCVSYYVYRRTRPRKAGSTGRSGAKGAKCSYARILDHS